MSDSESLSGGLTTYARAFTDAREAAGLSYRGLSAQLAFRGASLTPSALHHHASGRLKRPPTPALLTALSDVFDCPLSGLVDALYGSTDTAP